MRSRHGFTVIELLVVVAIIALLLAILLPAVGRVRDSGWEARCGSNEHQLMLAWDSYLPYNKHRIPWNTHDRGVKMNPNWLGVVAAEIRRRPVPWASPKDEGVMCPTVRRTFSESWGCVDVGYAVNALWTNAPREWNSWKSWLDIRHLDQYPWFFDPPVETNIGSGQAYYSFVPYQLAPFTGPTWGVGFYHAGGQRANVAYADGHVRGVRRAELEEAATSADDLSWFEKR